MTGAATPLCTLGVRFRRREGRKEALLIRIHELVVLGYGVMIKGVEEGLVEMVKGQVRFCDLYFFCRTKEERRARSVESQATSELPRATSELPRETSKLP